MVVGIDPGKAGAIVNKTAFWRLSMFYDDNRINPCKLQDFLIQHRVSKAIIEKQQLRTTQVKGKNGKWKTVVQANQFVLILNYGQILATLKLCGVEIIELTPQAIKKANGISGAKGKTAAIEKAEALGYFIPMLKPSGRTLKHDGVADAIMALEAGKHDSTTA